VKRLFTPILSITVLAIAGLPGSAWADTASTDPSASAADPTILAGAPGPGGATFSKSCQSPLGAAPAAGQTDNCTIHVQGSLAAGTQVTITLLSPQGSTVTACGGGSVSGPIQCSYFLPNGTTFFVGSESFTVSPSAVAGTPITQSARVCSPTCASLPVSVTGPGAAVAGDGITPPPPPPYVTKSCAGPNNDGTVYPGQQDTCTVLAASGDIFHSGNRVIVRPSGEGVTGCSGVAGVTSATENFERKDGDPGEQGISCTYTVLSGVTVLPGESLGTELITIGATAAPGSRITQGVNACSDGPGSPCGGPTEITASGPGGVVSADPPFTVTGIAIAATEGQSFTGAVATVFDEDPNASPSEYTADIVWGDGTDTLATFDGWSVSGVHTYLEEGTYSIAVTVRDPVLGQISRGYGSAIVSDAPLATQSKTINTTNPFNGTIASFTDADPNGAVGDYTATIDWGDTTTSPATVTQGAAGFDVMAAHAYVNLGPYIVTVHVCDAGGACADAISNLLMYANANGGNFVITDGYAARGSSATFWGAQWASAIPLAGRTGPADFKGFADNPSGPATCGSTWSTTAGNSSHPPDNVPTYMAVIVSSSISQDQARISGNSVELVIVKTDPGYAPDSGHSGTGTVIAVLCP